MSRLITSIQASGEDDETGTSRALERPGGLRRILAITAAILIFITAAVSIFGYAYWNRLKTTPAYSLATLIDAARHDDQATIDLLIDTSSVVDDFIPQITDKAVDIYGRGLPPQSLARVAEVAAPIMPAVKDRARAEVPVLIRRKSKQFENVPFAALVIGADRYLDVEMQGSMALVKSKLPGHSFEVRMAKNGERWQIVGVRDNELAERIAKAVGQEIIAVASKNGKGTSGERLGVNNLTELLKNAEEALK